MESIQPLGESERTPIMDLVGHALFSFKGMRGRQKVIQMLHAMVMEGMDLKGLPDYLRDKGTFDSYVHDLQRVVEEGNKEQGVSSHWRHAIPYAPQLKPELEALTNAEEELKGILK